jgi:hypothetical protein
MVEKAASTWSGSASSSCCFVEIAELTPPLGFNIFVLQTMTGRDSNYVALARRRSSRWCCDRDHHRLLETRRTPDALIGVTKK